MKSTGRQFEPWHSWLSLVGLTWNMFVLLGMYQIYGLLYLELLDTFGAGPQRTGLVATIFALSGIFCSAPAGWMVDRWSPQMVLLVVPLIYLVGLTLSGFATSLFVVYVSYGALHGCANVSCFIATMAAVSKVFTFNRSLASGIIFAGGGLGSMLFPLIFHTLTDKFTFRGTLLIYAGNLSKVNIYLLLGASLVTAGMFTTLLPTFVGAGGSILVVLLIQMVLGGILAGGCDALHNQLVVNSVGMAHAGTALGVLGICFTCGNGLPPIIFGALKEATGTYTMVPRLCGVAMICAAFCIQLGRRPFCCPVPKDRLTSLDDGKPGESDC